MPGAPLDGDDLSGDLELTIRAVAAREGDGGTVEIVIDSSRGEIGCVLHPFGLSVPLSAHAETLALKSLEVEPNAVIFVGGAMGGLDGPAGGLYPRLAEALREPQDEALQSESPDDADQGKLVSGLASLRLHYRQPGEFEECVLDVLGGVSFLKGIGARRVALVGHSFGAAVVIKAGPKMREAIGIYRDAWRQAGHPGEGKIALGFHMFCHQDREEAHGVAKPNVNAYFRSLVAAAERDSGWGAGASSRDYPGYDGYLDILRAANFDSLLNGGTIWVGTPEDIRQQISGYAQEVGGFDTASLQVNFHLISATDAAASMRLFAQEIISTF